MKKKFSIPRLPKIKNSKKILLISEIIIILCLIYFGFQFFSKNEISFFWPFQKGKIEESGGLPRTPKGRVAPSEEFLEKMREQAGKTPSGTEFKGPTSPPPGR